MIQRIPLKDLCSMDITDGTHKTPTYADSGYIFLSSKNVTSGEIDWDNVMYIPEELHKELYQRVAPQKDDILLAKNGTTGVAALVDKEEIFDIYVSLALIRPNKNKIIPKYLLYAINSESSKRYFDSHLKGVGVPNLHLTHIRETPISVPDFRTQEEIIRRLDKVGDLIAKRRQQLEKLDLLVKARFVEMFGDCQRMNLQSLNDVCNFIDYRGKTPEKSERGIPLITAKNVKNNAFSIEPQEFIPEDNYESVMTRGIPQSNDVLFTTEAPMGNVCRIPKLYEKFCVGQRIITMQPHSDVLTSEYLEHILLTREFQDKLWQNSSGSTVKGIRSKLLGMILIPVPSIEQQKSFSFFVGEIEKTRISVKASLTKLETLKKALMQEYFG